MTANATRAVHRNQDVNCCCPYLFSINFCRSSAQSSLLPETNPFSYLKCWTDSSTGAYALSSSIAVPNPYTVCFEIRGRNCSNPESSCCKISDVVNFILDVGKRWRGHGTARTSAENCENRDPCQANSVRELRITHLITLTNILFCMYGVRIAVGSGTGTGIVCLRDTSPTWQKITTGNKRKYDQGH